MKKQVLIADANALKEEDIKRLENAGIMVIEKCRGMDVSLLFVEVEEERQVGKES